MLVTLRIIKDKEKEDTNGSTANFLKVIGNKERKMDMVFGNLRTAIAMSGTGLMEGSMALELIRIKTAFIKENLPRV